MMAKFRRKPVVIEAIQYNSLCDRNKLWSFVDTTKFHYINEDLFVHTLEGVMKVSEGDWIIKGVKGEFYPCKPDIFEKLYERVDE